MTFFLVRARCALVAATLLAAAPATLAAQARGGSAPAPATLWAAQNTPRELTLVWDSVAGAKSFRLYRGSGESAQVIARPEARVLRWVVPVTAAMVGAPQQFAIETIDAAGLPSPRASFNVVTPIAVTPGGGQVPAPATLTASEGGGGVTLTWDAVPGATAYAIGRSVRPGGLRPLCPLCSTQTTYVDRNPTAGAVHVYSVTAVTPRGASRATRSNEITPSGGGIVAVGGGTGGTSGGGSSGGGTGGTGDGTGGTAPLTIPAPPSDLSMRSPSATAFELTWTGSAGSTSYRILRALCSQAPQVVATVSTTTVSDGFDEQVIGAACGMNALTQPIKIAYSVVAVNAAGASAPASWPLMSISLPRVTGGTTTATIPPPPASIVIRPSTFVTTGVEATWQGGTGAESYRITRTLCYRNEQLAPVPAGAIGTSRPWLDTIPAAAIRANCQADFLGMRTVDVAYTIVAVNSAGASPPASSPHLTFRISSATLDALSGTSMASTAIATPTPLSAAIAGPMSVNLNWQSSQGAESYLISRSLCGKPPEVVKTVPITAGSPNVTTSDNVDWTRVNSVCPIGSRTALVVYSVAARSAAGTSAPAQFPALSLELARAVYGTAPPPAVTGARTGVSAGRVWLKWNTTMTATGYRIERALGAKGAYQPFKFVDGNVMYVTDSTANISTMSPYYRISAVNPLGSAPFTVFTTEP